MEAADFAWRRKAAFNHGSTAEAESSIDASRRSLAALPFPTPPWFLDRLDFLKGNLRVDDGEITTGLKLLETSVPALLTVNQSESRAREMQWMLGSALMFAGRHEEADLWLRRAMETRRRIGEGRHPYAAFDYMAIATNLSMKADYAAAAAVLDSMPKVDSITGEGGANPQRYARMGEWSRALLLLDQGQPGAALRLLQSNAPLEGEFDFDIAEFEERIGEAQCRYGAAPLGLVHLKKALASAEGQKLSPNAPWIAALRAKLGLCALAAGDSALARQSANRARAAFNAQPGVSPYYKKPLEALDRKLGLRTGPLKTS
jgi:hypothetical protein